MTETPIKTIWDGMSTEQHKKVIADIVIDTGCGVATAYCWMTGVRKPLPLYRKEVTRIVCKVTKKKWNIVYSSKGDND